ncbi:MAG: zinc transporter ZupT [Deferribacterales bacterium]
MDNNLIYAFLLTLLAGLSTGIGSLIAFLSKNLSPKFLSGSLGFSAGVMIYVSMVEIFSKAKISLVSFYGEKLGSWLTVISFFAGIALIAIIDKLIPSYENPHEVTNLKYNPTEDEVNSKKLVRMGIFSAIAIGIHNFPEGLATFISSLDNPKLGLSVAVAIAIHNIPEGIAVSVPIYYATKSKKKSFWLSFSSGLAEPIGAFIGYLILMHFLLGSFFGIVFGVVAGIMVFISLDELLPTAEEYGENHIAISWLVLGMCVMAISLLLFI